MSPEQARGEDVDHRTDIWSLGVVLYEMLTGVRPFSADRDMAVIHAIIYEGFLPARSHRTELPQDVDASIGKMLAKERGKRYSNASEVAGDLFAMINMLGSATMTRVLAAEEAVPSVAVLPFANLSADQEQEYFCDGMTEEIINALAQLEGMRVIARTSSFAFKGKNEDVREMGRQLGVGALLEGSVRRAGNRLRITTQLVNVCDGGHLWSERFDREMEDVFAIQDEISLAVSDALKVKLLGEDKGEVVKRHTESLEAYRAYLKGRYHWFIRSSDSIEKAIDYMKDAIALDPEYALAYAGLADCYAVLPSYRLVAAADVYPKAKAAALRALELDDKLAEAHNALACIMWNYEWDWDGSDRESRRAIELNPGYAQAYMWMAEGLVERGRFEEGVAMMNKARELDPLSLSMNARLGKVLYYARHYEAAKDILNATLEIDPDYSQARYFLSLVYAAEGRYDEAIEILPEGKSRAWVAILRAWNGEIEKSRELMEETFARAAGDYDIPAIRASFHFALGELDECFEWMNRAVDVKDPRLLSLIRSPKTDTIKDDPRFLAILKRMNLEP
jgi:serine/threonine-protein kinase